MGNGNGGHVMQEQERNLDHIRLEKREKLAVRPLDDRREQIMRK